MTDDQEYTSQDTTKDIAAVADMVAANPSLGLTMARATICLGDIMVLAEEYFAEDQSNKLVQAILHSAHELRLVVESHEGSTDDVAMFEPSQGMTDALGAILDAVNSEDGQLHQEIEPQWENMN